MSSPVLPGVIAVIPVYRNLRDTEECLESLRASSPMPATTIVVDDGSGDDTADRLASCFDWITLLRRASNGGYARAVNDGFAWAIEKGARFVLLLNNDITVDPDMAAELVRVMEEDPTVGISGPKIFYSADRNRIWALGGHVGPWTGRTRHYGRGRTSFPDVEPFDVDYVPGAAQLIRREVIEKVGPLDVGYEAYFEEVDFCASARRIGYRTVAVPSAVMWHKISASMGGPKSAKVKYLMTRNRHRFMRKHATGWRFARYLVLDLFVSSAELLFALFRLRPKSAAALIRGWFAGLCRD